MRLSSTLSIDEGDTADVVTVMAGGEGRGLCAQVRFDRSGQDFVLIGDPAAVAGFLVDALDRVRNAAEEASTLEARGELGNRHIPGRLTDELEAQDVFNVPPQQDHSRAEAAAARVEEAAGV